MEQPKTIGQKLRDARKKAGLTQEEVAGDHITRNMLCRIEKGSAMPSRATLSYLAQRLDLPVVYLTDDAASLVDCQKAKYLPLLKEELKQGHHRECLRLFRKYFTETDDELALIAATCCLELARTALHAGNMDTVEKTAEEALSFAKKTIYPTNHICAAAKLLAAVAANIQSPRFAILETNYPQLLHDAVMIDLFYYLTDNEEACCDPLYKEHLSAHRALTARDYRKALPLLQELESRRVKENMGALLLFRIYTDLEQCYRETSDFEAAYRYAGKRISLLAAFRS